MKKTLTMLLSALMICCMAATASAWEENVDYVSLGEITSANYPGSVAEGWPAPSTGTLLKGTIIAGKVGDEISAQGQTPELAFDGSPATYWTGFETTQRSFIGLILDQAYELTEVRVRPSDDMPTDRLHGLVVEGSNDGVHWGRIIEFRQDATGKTYHIFTPQTVTDQAYIDNGYGKRTDESMFWVGNGGSYSMYRVWSLGCMPSIGEVEFYGVAKEATVLDDAAAAALVPTTTWYPGNINVRSEAEVADIDGNLKGTVIGGGGAWNKAFYENAFDNNNRTASDPCYRGEHCWVGLMLDEPHALTSVKVLPKRGAYKNLEGCLIQGSLDGRTWVTLTQFAAEDCPEKQTWVEKTITDTNGYTYFRYITNMRSHGDIADIAFYGAPATAATNIPAAEKYPVVTYEKFEGQLIDTGITSTSVDGSLTGTIFGFGHIWFLNKEGAKSYESAFDGNTSTAFEGEHNYGSTLSFAGIKLDTPAVITEVKIHPSSVASWYLNDVSGTHIQGSVDGINWVDLAVYTDADIPAAVGWVSKPVSDTTAYTYLRYAASEYSGVVMAEVAFYGDIVETPAETDAPAVDVPGTDTPTEAPQTFDAGVIAAVAAVVSAAGYAIARKRK